MCLFIIFLKNILEVQLFNLVFCSCPHTMTLIIFFWKQLDYVNYLKNFKFIILAKKLLKIWLVILCKRLFFYTNIMSKLYSLTYIIMFHKFTSRICVCVKVSASFYALTNLLLFGIEDLYFTIQICTAKVLLSSYFFTICTFTFYDVKFPCFFQFKRTDLFFSFTLTQWKTQLI